MDIKYHYIKFIVLFLQFKRVNCKSGTYTNRAKTVIFHKKQEKARQEPKHGGKNMKAKKLVALALSAVLAVSALAGCGSSNGNKESSKADSSAAGTSSAAAGSEAEGGTEGTGATGSGTIVANLGAEPAKINTLLSTDAPGGDVSRHIITNLISLDENDNVIAGDQTGAGVAESWTISEDGLTYIFKLRQDMKWTNGDPVTAHDFEFSWKTLLNPETGADYSYFAYILKNGEAYNTGAATADDVGVKATDDYTLEVTLESPTAYALSSFAFPSFAPINQKFFESVGAEKYMTSTDEETFCTNGPYKMESWVHDSEIVLTKNTDYYAADKVAFAEKIVFKMIGDANTWLNSYRAGDLDVIGVNGEQREVLKGEGVEIHNFGDGAAAYLQFNMEKAGVKNQKIRQALSLAIDKDLYISSVPKNDSRPASGFTPPVISGLSKPFAEEVGELLPTKADPEQAKKLFEEGLAEEGMTADEFAAEITIIGDDSTLATKTLAFLQEQIRTNLGVTLQVESMPFKSRIENMHAGTFTIVFALWGPDYNDPNTFLDLFETDGGNNQGHYSNPDYDAKLDEARKEPDLAKRMQLMYDIEKIVCTDLPVAPVYWRYVDYVTSDRVEGVRRTMLQDFNLLYATVKE